MGHKFDRPGYGKGPKLDLLLEWMKKTAITVDLAAPIENDP